jgi:phosphoglycolate phosphatase
VTGLAVLDLDGTLVDSVDDLAASVNHALAAVGLPPRSRAEVEGFVGEGARRLVERAVGGRADLVDPALLAWHDHYAAHCLDRTRPYPGIEAALARATRRLAVLTNKPGPMARKILAGLGLLERFAEVVGGGEAPRKPDPAGLLGIVARAGVAPADAVLIGDSVVDVETGRAAGVPVVAVTWGLVAADALRAAGAATLVSRAEQLDPYLT